MKILLTILKLGILLQLLVLNAVTAQAEVGVTGFIDARGLCYQITNSATRHVDGKGFVYKPISEGDGKLVVLFPSFRSSSAATLYLGGQAIKRGTFSGRGNGNRPRTRFPAPGGAYPNGIQVCDGGTNWGGPPPPPPEPDPPVIVPILNLLLD